ncbi:MAG TPA: KGG domain-containing protein [Candidatus Saccharimonadales bacterium]|nr:KGG domain-containing protein [Candidatus Saccharimonadales bacterium]
MGISDRGFASMDKDKASKIQSMGGKASRGGRSSKMSRSEAGRKGAEAEPREAKRRGGHNSHR